MKDFIIKSMDVISAFIVIAVMGTCLLTGGQLIGIGGLILGGLIGILVSTSIVSFWYVQSSNNEQLRIIVKLLKEK